MNNEILTRDKNILITGLGLIGGSYAKALTKQGFAVNAIDINEDSLSFALTEKIIKSGCLSGTEAAAHLIESADIIIFGLYPSALCGWVSEHRQKFKTGALLTDVSGVKSKIVYPVQEILREDVEFIGSHPMAGREVSGVKNSSDAIFQNANFIVTPTDKNTEHGIAFAHELGRLLGFSRISVLSPEEHDEMIGYLSQLTHAIAVSLMNANENSHLKEYTGDSFRDLTRIAKINENLWSELFFLNKDILISEIDSFTNALQNLKQKLAADDLDGLKQLFKQSTTRRAYFDK